jgi:hypothetical protein
MPASPGLIRGGDNPGRREDLFSGTPTAGREVPRGSVAPVAGGCLGCGVAGVRRHQRDRLVLNGRVYETTGLRDAVRDTGPSTRARGRPRRQRLRECPPRVGVGGRRDRPTTGAPVVGLHGHSPRRSASGRSPNGVGGRVGADRLGSRWARRATSARPATCWRASGRCRGRARERIAGRRAGKEGMGPMGAGRVGPLDPHAHFGLRRILHRSARTGRAAPMRSDSIPFRTDEMRRRAGASGGSAAASDPALPNASGASGERRIRLDRRRMQLPPREATAGRACAPMIAPKRTLSGYRIAGHPARSAAPLWHRFARRPALGRSVLGRFLGTRPAATTCFASRRPSGRTLA